MHPIPLPRPHWLGRACSVFRYKTPWRRLRRSRRRTRRPAEDTPAARSARRFAGSPVRRDTPSGRRPEPDRTSTVGGATTQCLQRRRQYRSLCPACRCALVLRLAPSPNRHGRIRRLVRHRATAARHSRANYRDRRRALQHPRCRRRVAVGCEPGASAGLVTRMHRLVQRKRQVPRGDSKNRWRVWPKVPLANANTLLGFTENTRIAPVPAWCRKPPSCTS